MESSQILLNNGLTFLVIATGVMIIIVGGFFVKLLIDLSRLSKNLNESATLITNEVQPVIRELNQTIKGINSITQNANRKVDSISKVFEDMMGAGSNILLKARNMSGSFVKILTQSIVVLVKLFMKKK